MRMTDLIAKKRDGERLSTEEIADALGIPRNTVLTRLRRAREQLKSEWTEA